MLLPVVTALQAVRGADAAVADHGRRGVSQRGEPARARRPARGCAHRRSRHAPAGRAVRDASRATERRRIRCYDKSRPQPAPPPTRYHPRDFTYDAAARTCVCPAGKSLYRTGRQVVINGYVGAQFRGAKRDCLPCPHRPQCLRTPDRTATRQVRSSTAGSPAKPKPDTATARMRRRIDAPEGRAQYGQRFATVEPVFGEPVPQQRARSLHPPGPPQSRRAMEALLPRPQHREARPSRVRELSGRGIPSATDLRSPNRHTSPQKTIELYPTDADRRPKQDLFYSLVRWATGIRWWQRTSRVHQHSPAPLRSKMTEPPPQSGGHGCASTQRLAGADPRIGRKSSRGKRQIHWRKLTSGICSTQPAAMSARRLPRSRKPRRTTRYTQRTLEISSRTAASAAARRSGSVPR